MSTVARVHHIPPCDLCKGRTVKPTPAMYDAKTVFGAWAFMCQAHWDVYGIGVGTGLGQVLELIPADSERA
jgi:hypothetical protein